MLGYHFHPAPLSSKLEICSWLVEVLFGLLPPLDFLLQASTLPLLAKKKQLKVLSILIIVIFRGNANRHMKVRLHTGNEI